MISPRSTPCGGSTSCISRPCIAKFHGCALIGSEDAGKSAYTAQGVSQVSKRNEMAKPVTYPLLAALPCNRAITTSA
jgi:hypothetical protein